MICPCLRRGFSGSLFVQHQACFSHLLTSLSVFGRTQKTGLASGNPQDMAPNHPKSAEKPNPSKLKWLVSPKDVGLAGFDLAYRAGLSRSAILMVHVGIEAVNIVLSGWLWPREAITPGRHTGGRGGIGGGSRAKPFAGIQLPAMRFRGSDLSRNRKWRCERWVFAPLLLLISCFLVSDSKPPKNLEKSTNQKINKPQKKIEKSTNRLDSKPEKSREASQKKRIPAWLA